MKIVLLIILILSSYIIITAEENIFDQTINTGQKRCVKIYGGAIGQEHGYASGVIVSSEGHILTAIGMFLSSERLRVTMDDGLVYPAKVLKRDRTLQLALIKIDTETPHYFTLNENVITQRGDLVLALANPFKVADGDEKLSVNLGVVSLRSKLEVKRRAVDVEYSGDALLIDAITGNPGSQGGALLNKNGDLVGMIGKVLEYRNSNTRINYAVPVDILKSFYESDPNLKKEQKDIFLGIKIFDVSGDKAPAFIDRVELGSPAFMIGLKKDDLIISIGDMKIVNCGDYKKALKQLVPDIKIKMLIKRGENFYQLEIEPKILELEIEFEDEDEIDLDD